MDPRTSEVAIRAAWFALFATVALVLGGFAIGYGTAVLMEPSSEPVPAPLPTLAEAPRHGMDPASSLEAADGATARDAVEATPPPVEGGSWQGSLQGETPVAVLAASLDNVDVNPALGGVEVVLRLHNSSDQTVSFSFWPETDLSAVDGEGRHYELQWAEFDGTVEVPPKESVQLVRAFFAGMSGEGAGRLTVTVGHPPQLPDASWEVPLPARRASP